ncbi:MAG TPA: hypothetical protein VK985_03090 [Rariglobus sp.]|nr:hypothetical protein [Rariglobus sp.]
MINLDDRQDRWNAIQSSAGAFLRDAPPLTRISALWGVQLPGYGTRPWFHGKPSDKRWAAKGGCTQSHRKAVEHARHQGWNTFLVLEDDADLRLLTGINLEALAHQLFTEHPDWDVCYLGFSKAVGPSLELASCGEHHVYEVIGCYAGHAYIVKARARDWILDQVAGLSGVWPWLARHRIIDRWYARNLTRVLRVFAVSPSIITQVPSYSDIVQRTVNYDEQFTGRIKHLSHGRRAFELRKTLHYATMSFTDAYDALRGLIKRFRGF